MVRCLIKQGIRPYGVALS